MTGDRLTSCANSLDQFCISFVNEQLRDFIQKCLFGESHSGDDRSLNLYRITKRQHRRGTLLRRPCTCAPDRFTPSQSALSWPCSTAITMYVFPCCHCASLIRPSPYLVHRQGALGSAFRTPAFSGRQRSPLFGVSADLKHAHRVSRVWGSTT